MGYLEALTLAAKWNFKIPMDDGKVAEFVDALFQKSGFARITDELLRDAFRFLKVDGDRILREVNPAPLYIKKNHAELKVLLTQIVGKVADAAYQNAPPPLPPPRGVLRSGESITGAGPETGSIGGFLINDRDVIFLYSDAHVIVTDPWADRQDNVVKVDGTVIGRIAWHPKITAKGPNFDVALARIDPAFYGWIRFDCVFKGRDGQKHLTIVNHDSDLSKGKQVYLLGATSGRGDHGKVGKIKGPAEQNIEVKYPVAGGGDERQDLELSGLVTVENLDSGKAELGVQGDSGGLWVGGDGRVVGMQITGGEGTWESGFIPIETLMRVFRGFDPSLRLLLTADIARITASAAAPSAAAAAASSTPPPSAAAAAAAAFVTK